VSVTVSPFASKVAVCVKLSASLSATWTVPAGQSDSDCALAGEAKTPIVATAIIATMAISTSAIEYGLIVIVILLTTAPLLSDA